MEVRTERVEVALGLGSNLGDRLACLREAAARLQALGPITRRSDVFETEPWGLRDQPWFLNACLTVEPREKISPPELLAFVKGIERDMGRRESRRWGERNIDVDILFIGGLVHDAPELQVPHVNLPNRGFVLVPLRQILPGWVHPSLGLSVAEMEMEIRQKTLNPSAISRIVQL